MRFPRIAMACLMSFMPLAAHAADPVTVEKAVYTFTVQPNGGFTEDATVVRRIGSDAAAQRAGQYFIDYSPSLERIEDIEASTVKPDGRVIKVAPDAIRDQAPPGDPMKLIFTDTHQKVVIYPGAAAGDRLVLHYRDVVANPRIPGGFEHAGWFSRAVTRNEVILRYDLPKGMHLRVEQSGFQVTTEDKTGRDITTLRLDPMARHWPDPAVVGVYSRLPHYFVSTFPSHATFAAAYAKLALPHARVTPEIQAKADEVTKGITDRHAQAVALYDWVSHHIRYVASYFGDGPIEPHDAAEVLANQYGDCKDHVVLLHALLAAKGIRSEMVLINLSNDVVIGKPPTLAPFDHMITYIPEFHQFVDSTNGVAPFGVLLNGEEGKPVLMLGGNGPAVRTTPIAPVTANRSDTVITETMATDGSLSGTDVTSGAGPTGGWLRYLGKAIEGAGAEAVVARIIAREGEHGSGSAQLIGFESDKPSYRAHATFELAARPERLDGDAFKPFPGLMLIGSPGSQLFVGLYSRDLPAAEAMLCWPGTQTETITLGLPVGYTVDRLPHGVTIKDPEFSYSSQWTEKDGVLTVRREMVSEVKGPVCAGELRQRIAKAAQRIRVDGDQRVALQREGQ